MLFSMSSMRAASFYPRLLFHFINNALGFNAGLFLNSFQPGSARVRCLVFYFSK